ncbi:hepatitis A virus cellular receptor 1 homolog [Synchiropus picturatus]
MRALWYFILGLFTQAQSSTLRLTGTVGQNVTLPCRYVKQPGVELDFCWGRGPVPTFKCSNTILSFVNGDVSFLSDHSYRLLGRVSVGDMSLTIINAQMSHAGAYGCRVELPGWFNDYKVNMELLMEEALTATEDYPYDLEDDLSTEVTIMEVGASSNALISFEVCVFIYTTD